MTDKSINIIETEEYVRRVYAGVLGKIIGVYMGRPVEGWTYKKIQKELGDIWYYVHDRIGLPLVVTDDDISGTFTFIRALEDLEQGRSVEGEDVAEAWLNYIIENRTILWWGGKGVSTEHTAYLALKEGILPPESGSAARNGKIVAEQIGAQIFIDGWAMAAPGDPDLAASMASKAAHVSHDGESVYGAIIVAVMESLAFIESDTTKILKTALRYIPEDSEIYRMNTYILKLYEEESDWRSAWEAFSGRYNYVKYPGVCHVVPNHGLVILSLLFGGDDFQKSQMIVNTCGWDTDCNAANVGCFLGIKNGLSAINAGADFRTPVRDRMYLATADGGRAINNALTVSYQLVNSARKINGLKPLVPKNGARFHFSQPGSVQGFYCEIPSGEAPQPVLDNVLDDSVSDEHLLRCRYKNLSRGQHLRMKTACYIPPEDRDMPGYEFIASPLLYSGQTVTARCFVKKATKPIEAAVFVQVNGHDDKLLTRHGKFVQLKEGEWTDLALTVEECGGQPVTFVGIEYASPSGGSDGVVYVDYLGWDAKVRTELLPEVKPNGRIWSRAWVDSVDLADFHWGRGIRISKDPGTGLIYQGNENWGNYKLQAEIIPHLFRSGGIAFGIKGLRNYHAVRINAIGRLELVKVVKGKSSILGSAEMDFEWENPAVISLSVSSSGIAASCGGTQLSLPIDGSGIKGGAGFTVESGSLTALKLSVECG